VEEVGELARAVIKGRQGVRGGSARWEAEKATEAADVLISLIAFCNQNDIDLAHAATERWKKVGARVAASTEEQAR
jgi:NTP pyrophosphatase (non-canonical NTP hydrolase)